MNNPMEHALLAQLFGFRSLHGRSRTGLTHRPGEHFAGFGAVGRAHETVALHALDHARGAVVADAHLTLEHRDADLPHLRHDRHRLAVELVGQLVLFARRHAFFFARP